MARSYVYDMVDTWDAAGTTFTAIKMNVTNTASAVTSRLIDLQVGGASLFNVRRDGVATAAASFETPNFGITDVGGQFYWKNDLFLTRDAADTLAQRRGVNAQTFRVYNTYTDASNYERGELSWSANEFTVGTTRAGTGTNRRLILAGAQDILLHTSNTARWAINGSGHFLTLTDNTYDIGASGANRPRTLYLGTALNLGGISTVQAVNGTIYICGAAETASGGSSYIKATNANPLVFGTNNTDRWNINTSGNIIANLDNTYDIGASGANRPRNIYAAGQTDIAGLSGSITATAVPAGGTQALRMTTTSALGVYVGSGAPTVSAAKGSLYLRTDGTTTNDRMYVNTNGSTTWTAVTTAA